MLHSKATAALMRLKEMDRKYNIKRNEATRIQSNINTDSSLENSPRSSQVKFKALNGKQDSAVLHITHAEKENKPKVLINTMMDHFQTCRLEEPNYFYYILLYFIIFDIFKLVCDNICFMLIKFSSSNN